ncbi:MAG: alpha/beta fold hydrolase [Pirellulales bacterium]|nr:alpha/beta fold hydrolase [Pirellulales bacterium]
MPDLVPLVELVQVRTSDGVRLDGSMALPIQTDAARRQPVDAALCLHGTGGNFYGGGVFEGLTPKLLADGISVLRANTRGHDAVSMATTLRGPQRLGAAFERVGDSRHDVVAWLEFLAERGFQAVALVGHSLGAIKAIHSLIHAPHPLIKRLIAISPPRLSYSYFMASEKRDEFLKEYANAEIQFAAGNPNSLLDVKIPLPFLVSAASYLEKYGPDEKFNFLRQMDQIKVPTLFVFGGLEVEREMPFRNLPQAVIDAASPTQPIRVVTVVGANHVYTGRLDELSFKVRAWLASA